MTKRTGVSCGSNADVMSIRTKTVAKSTAQKRRRALGHERTKETPLVCMVVLTTLATSEPFASQDVYRVHDILQTARASNRLTECEAQYHHWSPGCSD